MEVGEIFTNLRSAVFAVLVPGERRWYRGVVFSKSRGRWEAVFFAWPELFLVLREFNLLLDDLRLLRALSFRELYRLDSFIIYYNILRYS